MNWIPYWVLGMALVASPAFAAQGDDPSWPCIQRKVPQLSLAQIWNGPELPSDAADWAKDSAVSKLVEELSARRLPLPQAQAEIDTYRNSLPPEQRPLHAAMLVQGLFEKMNDERAHVIAGIARYAQRQREMAANLRRESSAVGALRASPDADPHEIALRSEQLAFQIRIFQERVQSLTFVCEVPTLIEQRLYALVKAIQQQGTAR